MQTKDASIESLIWVTSRWILFSFSELLCLSIAIRATLSCKGADCSRVKHAVLGYVETSNNELYGDGEIENNIWKCVDALRKHIGRNTKVESRRLRPSLKSRRITTRSRRTTIKSRRITTRWRETMTRSMSRSRRKMRSTVSTARRAESTWRLREWIEVKIPIVSL